MKDLIFRNVKTDDQSFLSGLTFLLDGLYKINDLDNHFIFIDGYDVKYIATGAEDHSEEIEQFLKAEIAITNLLNLNLVSLKLPIHRYKKYYEC